MNPRRFCLVTGASSGIGAAFARLYAARGYDLCLTARRAERLESLAAELRQRHGVDVLTAPADLAALDGVDRVLAAIRTHGRQVDALVNNAGYGVTGAYAETRWTDQQAFVQVLVTAVAELAHKVLPPMIEQRFGRILNVASIAGLLPGLPSQTLYGAAKSFVISFSESLHLETRDTGVHVAALCPGLTRSEFHEASGIAAQVSKVPAWLWMDAAAVAEAGYRAVEANQAVVVPGAPNRLATGLFKVLPGSVGLGLTGWAMKRTMRS